MTIVTKSDKFCIMRAFRPFLRILMAFNRENIRPPDRRQTRQNICLAIGVCVGTALIASTLSLATWHLVDLHGDLNEIVVTTPIMLTIFVMLVTIGVLIPINREVDATVSQIQIVIDQREFSMKSNFPCVLGESKILAIS